MGNACLGSDDGVALVDAPRQDIAEVDGLHHRLLRKVARVGVRRMMLTRVPPEPAALAPLARGPLRQMPERAGGLP